MIDMHHPDIAISIARLRHEELTRNVSHHTALPRPRRRFLRRRRDTAAPVVLHTADLVELPPPREGHEVDERRVA